MADNLAEEIEDLTTCCICLHPFDSRQHKPKYLTCLHTLCLICIKVLLRQANGIGDNYINCPRCRQACDMPQLGPDNLRSNPHALLQGQLLNQLNNNGRWCVVCKSAPKEACEGAHATVDYRRETDEVGSLRNQAITHFKSAISIREQLQPQYRNRSEQLRRELAVAELEEKENNSCLLDLARKLKKCETSKRESWLPSHQDVNFTMVIDGAKKTLKEAEQQFEQAQDLLLVASQQHPVVTEPSVNVSSRNQSAPVVASTFARTFGAATISNVRAVRRRMMQTQSTASLLWANGITRSVLWIKKTRRTLYYYRPLDSLTYWCAIIMLLLTFIVWFDCWDYVRSLNRHCPHPLFQSICSPWVDFKRCP